MIAHLFQSSIGWRLHAIILGIVLVMSTLCGYIYYYKTRDSRDYERLLSNLSLVNSTPRQVSDVVGDIMLYQKSPTSEVEARITNRIDSLIQSTQEILYLTDTRHEDSKNTAKGLLEIMANLQRISKESTEEINKGTKSIQLYENIDLLNILTEVVQKNVYRYVSSELAYAVALKNRISNRNAILGLLLAFFILLSLIFVCVLVVVVRKSIIMPVHDLENAIKVFQNSGVHTEIDVVAEDEIGHLAKAFNAMAVQLLSSMEKLQKSEEKYRSIFDNATEGIFQATPQGTLLSANPAAASILGYSRPGELMDHSGDEGLKKFFDDPRQIEDLLRRFEQRDTVSGFETVMTKQDRTPIWIFLNARAVRDATGELVGLEGSFSDISERKQAEEELKKHKEDLEALVKARTRELEIANKGLETQTVELAVAKEEADAASAAKSIFLANMSHEIRTPINVIVGLTNVLLKSELSDSQRSHLNKVKVASKNLLEVINDILDFSKVEAGRLDLELAPFDLVLVFEQLADLFSNRVAQKDLELIYAMAPQTPRWLTGDDGRLTQVLTNLIENAIKFTNAGEIVVSVEPDPQEVQHTGQTFLKFQVIDTGAGIDGDVLPTLFESFTQADGSLTRKHEGTGLGLAICRRLVELMGGTIEAHSEPGKGSRFVFTAKLETSSQEDTAINMTGSLSELKALVVDDSAAARQALVDMLESFNIEVVAVDSGEKAIETLRRTKEDPLQLVFLDLKMPGLNGIETAQGIHELMAVENENRHPDNKTPIIIMVTAYGRDQVQGQMDEWLIDAMLLKPVKPSELYNAIINLLGDVWGTAERREERAPDESRIPMLSHRRVLVVEDSSLNRDVAMALLEDTGIAVEVAENGRIALEKVSGAPKGYYDAVLMDIQMPVMDGYEATRRIRAWEAEIHDPDQQSPNHDTVSLRIEGRAAKTRIPIIALTAHALKGEKQKCLDAKMDDYLSKPIDEQDLYQVLNRWIAP